MARRTRFCAVACTLHLLVFLSSPAQAQPQGRNKLSDILPALVGENIQGNANVIADVIFFSGLPLSDSGLLALLDQIDSSYRLSLKINELVGNQLSSFPLGSSAGGFSWTFDPALGAFNRVTSSFGPSFSERALTVGRRKLNLGVNYQRVTFDELRGKSLDGGIKLYTGVTCRMIFLPCNDAIFIEDTLNLKLSADTVGIFATYGLTDRIDVGVAVPIVRVEMDATLVEHFGLSSSGIDPEVFYTESRSGSAQGIGDVTVRGKYNFWKTTGGGLAAGVDVRLPSGDELDMLGIAGLQSKVYLAGSIAQGAFSPHVNVGYTFSREGDTAKELTNFVIEPADEFNYAVGVDVAVTPRFTVVGDFVGRSSWDVGTLSEVDTFAGGDFRQLDWFTGRADNLLGSLGFKVNPFAQSLLSVNLLFPVTKQGLTDKVAWVAGFEISF